MATSFTSPPVSPRTTQLRASREDGRRQTLLIERANPIIIASYEVLRAVPGSIREATYALGASRWHIRPRQVTGDATYGTVENMKELEDDGMRAFLGGGDGVHPTQQYHADLAQTGAEMANRLAGLAHTEHPMDARLTEVPEYAFRRRPGDGRYLLEAGQDLPISPLAASPTAVIPAAM